VTSLLEVKCIEKSFKLKGYWYHKQKFNALAPVSFTIEANKTLAVVGEAGSGKSTLAKILVGAETPNAGNIYLNGQKLKKQSL
jgi:cationic peptide transport system ATP-binding protein